MRGRVKKWGNSLGLRIPAEAASKEGLKDGDEVDYSVKKCGDITEVFGLFRSTPVDAQAMKDETRESDMEKDQRLSGQRRAGKKQ